ncbi:hypothetical protein MNBD_BACTEROID05-1080, partial [hydrothermal vent metagenome]
NIAPVGNTLPMLLGLEESDEDNKPIDLTFRKIEPANYKNRFAIKEDYLESALNYELRNLTVKVC